MIRVAMDDFRSAWAMKRTVRLRTSEGHKLRIALDNWGSGLDHTLRRWTLADGYWECMDTGELAEECGLSGLMAFSDWSPLLQLSLRGQTMVEYALIIAAVAVVAWGAYNLTGHDIGSMASGIDSALTSA
jgi:Flp pilus assembly pilin Flp